MSYKELQSALKTLRSQGTKLNVKLNATKVALQAEYDRITGNASSKQEPAQDELAAAKARIAELEAQVAQQQATMQQMARIIEGYAAEEQTSEPEPQQPEQAIEQASDITATQVMQAAEKLAKQTENYTPVFMIAQELGLSMVDKRTLWAELHKLQASDKIEARTLVHADKYTQEQNDWGYMTRTGSPIFFVIIK